MQIFIPHSSCAWEEVVPSQHIQGTMQSMFSKLHLITCYVEIWKGGGCFGSLIKIFVSVHWSALSFSCICSVLSHTAPTVDILLFLHFYISLCEVLLIHYPCLLHGGTYIVLFSIFVFIYEFSFLITILIVSIIYLNISTFIFKKTNLLPPITRIQKTGDDS